MESTKTQKVFDAFVEASDKLCKEEMFGILLEDVLGQIQVQVGKRVITFDIISYYPTDVRNAVLKHIVTKFSLVAKVVAIYYKDYRQTRVVADDCKREQGYAYNVIPVDYDEFPMDNRDGPGLPPTRICIEYNKLAKKCFASDTGFITLDAAKEFFEL